MNRVTIAIIGLVMAAGLAGCTSSSDRGEEGSTDETDPFPFLVDDDGFVDRGFSGVQHLSVDFPSPFGGTVHAEIYLPGDLGPDDRVPVLLEVSPYTALEFRQLDSPVGNGLQSTYFIDRFVERGYAVVFADARGFGGSSGCWDDHGDNEQADVMAAVVWAAGQSWSTGDVGMVGSSYSGATQLLAAVGQAEGLKTIFAVAPVSGVYENHWQNGVAYRWDRALPSGSHFNAVYTATTAVPPWNDAGSYPGYVQGVVDQPECQPRTTLGLTNPDGTYTDYFVERDRQDDGADVEVSVFWVHGFWDQSVKPSLFLPMWNSIEAPKRAWFWHGDHEVPTVETSGRSDGADQMHMWYDHWLYGLDNGIMELPTVEVQDSLGRWRFEEKWPPEDAEPLRLVPTKEGNLHVGGAASGTVSFTTDPYTSFSDNRGPVPRLPEGAHFTAASEPLKEPLHLAGTANYTARLSSDDTHGQIVVALFDVDPDDVWTLVDRTAFGLRHREGLEKVVDVVPGETMDLSFEGWPTDWVFEEGHRVATVYVGTEYRYVTPDAKHTLTLELGEGTATELSIVPWRTETFDQTSSSALEKRERMGPPEGFGDGQYDRRDQPGRTPETGSAALGSSGST